MRRFVAVFIAALCLFCAPALADRNSDLKRILRTIVAAAPQNFEPLAQLRDGSAAIVEVLPRGLGAPLFQECGVGARLQTVIIQCTRTQNGQGPLYATAAAYERAVIAALGASFSRTECPSWHGLPDNVGLEYIGCFDNAAGVLVSIYREPPEQHQSMPQDRMRGNYDDYAFDVRGTGTPDWRVATLQRMFSDVLPRAQRAPAAYAPPGWLTGVRSDTLAGSMAQLCRYTPINGHVGIACEYGNQYGDYFASPADVDRSVAAALPGFHRSTCARPHLGVHEVPRTLISCYTSSTITVYASSLAAYGSFTLAFDMVDAAAPAMQTPPAK